MEMSDIYGSLKVQLEIDCPGTPIDMTVIGLFDENNENGLVYPQIMSTIVSPEQVCNYLNSIKAGGVLYSFYTGAGEFANEFKRLTGAHLRRVGEC